MAADLHIDFAEEAGDWPDEAECIIEKAVRHAWSAPGGVDRGRIAELSVVLSDDAHVRDLNRDYRGKDKPTNVLSFPAELDMDIPGAPRMLGDIVLALETVQREALEQSKTAEAHLTHLSVHGLLHLLGYDHIEEEEAQQMEALEVRLLADLGIANPYGDTYRAPDEEVE